MLSNLIEAVVVEAVVVAEVAGAAVTADTSLIPDH
jgi:hypothetical protein